ncbi:ferredoxin [Rhizobium sp. NRK18]|uniref:ferredoxin n=1 Tax=Rhizobium sp. NRK18 TaxID=2964667 RepID=UPI0021C323FE|nr:ferredoxin [Rhizobium sp. NRK18]MCQ2003865.1 ferredoxin [Rhizobium sp. NRK18]
MMGEKSLIDSVRAALQPHGVFVRGTVNFDDEETAPRLADGGAARSVILIGNIGGSLWSHFDSWRNTQLDCGGGDPLDAWSKEVISPVAIALGGTAYFPSDPPWQPFQQWARQAEGLKASPLGILIHPQYGLWHGYRGAIGFATHLREWDGPAGGHPCDDCEGKPCISRCPAGAVSASGFAVTPCRQWLATAEGQAGCLDGGCLAREACPVGSDYRYPEAQLRFHMQALKI